MRRTSLIQAILLSLFAAAAVAQPNREIRGQVFHLGKNSQKIPEKGIVVTCLETGSSDDTNDQGLFRLPLPPTFHPGNKITLNIDKPGWRIRYPLEGEVVIPASLGKEIVPIELLPTGSKLFWTSDRIEKFLEDSIAKAKREASQGQTVTIDIGRYLKDWALSYGFTPQDAQKEIDRWIIEVEENQGTVHELGLAAFAKKQFADAARHFRDSAEWSARQWKETQRRAEELEQKANKWREGLIRDLLLEGDSYFQAGEHLRALASYQEAHGHTSRDETPKLWAATLHDIGRARLSIKQGDWAERIAQLEQAAPVFRQALLVYTREQSPEMWAGTQLNLGVTLAQLAGRVLERDHSSQLLAEAAGALRQALLVFTREKFPEHWATVQIDLCSLLASQGSLTNGEVGSQLLVESVDACRQALFVWTHEQVPQRWGMVQHNLGTALSALGKRTEGERGAQLLGESVEAIRQALFIFPREQFPYEWGVTQATLASSLLDYGLRTEGELGAQILGESVEAHRQALLVLTRQQFPYEWAMAQAGLGNSLLIQSLRTEGERSIQFLSESLLVHTRERLPKDWVKLHNNLASVPRQQDNHTESKRGCQSLADSVEAYRQALLVRTREQFTYDWATLQNNLGFSLREEGRRTEGERGVQLLAEAVLAFRRAREIFTYEQFPREWALSRKEEILALMLSARYEDAAQGCSDILEKNPNHAWAANTFADLLNNYLFDHHQALSISQQWLARNPEDLWSRYLEIEALFSTRAFGDCKAKSASLQKVAGLTPRQRTALVGYEFAAAMAAGSPDASAVLERLIHEVEIQPSDFRTGFNFPGTLHALGEPPDLPHHGQLVRLFQALESQDRDSILQGLRNLQSDTGEEGD